MIKSHRDALRKSRIALIQDLQASNIINHLVQYELLTDREYDEVKAAKTSQEKNELILQLIPRKGTTAFDRFVAVLSEVPGQQHLAKKLLAASETHRSKSLPSPTEVKTFGDGVPPRPRALQSGHSVAGTTSTGQPVMQPTEDTPEKGMLHYVTSTTTPDWATRSGRTSEPPASTQLTVSLDNSQLVYPMSHQPRGLALIVNNKHFHPKCRMKERAGTDIDADALHKLWTRLGFLSKIFTDLSAEDMRKQLKALACHNHSNYDCVIVSLLTHGVVGELYGSDGERVPVEELIAYFNADKAHRTLVGKPKLFFIQACRGDTFDKGVEYDDIDSGCDETDAKLASLPVQSDMLIAYATTPGYVSWRNSECGSWFIQGIARVFDEHADREDVTSMMVLVNQVVATEFVAGKRNKQIPSPIVRLTKKLYFRPGFFKK